MPKLPCGPPWTTKAIGSLAVAYAAGRLHLHAPDLVAVGAGEAELLEAHRVELGQQVAVDVGQLRDLALGVDAVEVVGRHHAVRGEERAAAGQRHDVAGMAVAGQPRDLAGWRRRRGTPALPALVGGDAGSTCRPCAQAIEPTERSQLAVSARTWPVARSRSSAPGGRPRSRRAPSRNKPGCGRRATASADCRCRHCRRQVGRLGRAVGGRGENVEVGRGRLDPPRLAQREIDGPAVGARCRSPRRRRTAWTACRRPARRSPARRRR